MNSTLKNNLIKIAYENPELRDELLPIILKQASLDKQAEFQHFAGNLFTSGVSGALATAILAAFLHGAPAEAKEKVSAKIKADPANAVKVLHEKDVKAAKALLEEAGFTVSEKVSDAQAEKTLEKQVDGNGTLSQAADSVADFFSGVGKGISKGVKGLFGGSSDPTDGLTPVKLKYPARNLEVFDAGGHYLVKVTGVLQHSPNLARDAVQLRVRAAMAENDGFDYSDLGQFKQIDAKTWTVEVPKMGPKGPANPGVKVETVRKVNDKTVHTVSRNS